MCDEGPIADDLQLHVDISVYKSKQMELATQQEHIGYETYNASQCMHGLEDDDLRRLGLRAPVQPHADASDDSERFHEHAVEWYPWEDKVCWICSFHSCVLMICFSFYDAEL